jgi:hypothetical protein
MSNKQIRIKLCDCGKNITVFLFALMIPGSCICIQVLNASRVVPGKHSTLNSVCLGIFCGCIGYTINRIKLKTHINNQNQDKDFCSNCMSSFFCPVCAVTQEYLMTLQSLNADLTLLICEDPKSQSNQANNYN